MSYRAFISRTWTRALLTLACAATLLSIIAWGATEPSAGEAGPVRGQGPHAELRVGASTGELLPTPLDLSAADGGAPAYNLSSSIQQLISGLAATFDAALQSDPNYHRYVECIARHGPEAEACREARSAAIYHALDVHVVPALLAQTELLLALRAQFGDDAIVAQLMASLSSAASETERLAILAVATRDPLPPRAFPGDAYAGLENASVPEQTMLLTPHEVVSIEDPGLARRVSDIAVDTSADLRTRRASIKALGHGETAHALAQVARSLREESSEILDGVALQLGEALGRCGPACVDTVEALARGSRRERMIAYEAVLTSSPGRAAAFQEALLRAGEASDADEEERRRRDHAIRLGRY